MASTSMLGGVLLRVVHITDVYKLNNFPFVKTLLAEKRREAEERGGKCISILTGDFLAPYLLSSLDKGTGMVSMLNNVPIDYVMFGNHEDDLPHPQVCKRIAEYKGTWLNSNMTDHAAMEHQKTHDVIDLEDPLAPAHKRKVGLVAVLSDSPSLYRSNAFGGATIADPYDTLAAYKERLEGEGCDLVIPLCHLYEPQDEVTCKRFDFPVIFSGHDHHVVNRVVSGSRLVKPGADAEKAAVTDLYWKGAGEELEITVDVVDVKDWKADSGLEEKVTRAYSVLDHLAHTELCPIPESCRPLSSANSRGQICTMSRFLWSQFRDALNAEDNVPENSTVDCVLLSGGDIRGGKDYEDDSYFSLEDLKSEIQEQFEAVIVPMTGKLLSEGFKATHGQPNPGFLQHDDGIELDEAGNIVKVKGEPIDMEKTYKVAVSKWDILDGPSKPFTDHFTPKDVEQLAYFPVYATLLGHFADHVWRSVWNRLDRNHDGKLSAAELAAVDQDGDGRISKAELCDVMQKAGFEVDKDELSFVDVIMSVAGDDNGDGYLSPDELHVEG